MYKKLTEAVNVENAIHIGTAHGYDVFDILTYEAAQQFTVEDRNDLAGAAYTQNANTFRSNINQTQHLYFFAKENTNKVYGAIVKSNSTHSIVRFVGSGDSAMSVQCNFLFENAGENSSNTYYDKPLPFFLIPGATFEGREGECLLVENHLLAAAFIQFHETDSLLNLENLPDSIRNISALAFNYGVEVSTIKLGENIVNIDNHAMDKVHDAILVTTFDIPESWGSQWNAGKENITTLGYGMDPEAVAEHERQVAAAQEAERLRREEEARRQAEEEQRRAEREVRKLRYKIKGKEVIITGTISGIDELEIPEMIEGKPVTTIAAYAFFEEENLRRIDLPRTLKLIEQGAFFNSGVYSIRIPKNCIVGKYNDTVHIYRI